MGAEIKKCQNCGKDFTIEPADFAFYEKINPVRNDVSNGVKVPALTWCPECRLQNQ